jgi:polyphenol oxidase
MNKAKPKKRPGLAQEHFEAEGHITVPHLLDAGGAGHFFGTRAQRLAPLVGEVSVWTPEEAEAAAALRVVAVKQVHGTDALVLDRPVDVGERYEGGWDALVTDQPGVLLTIRTADCVPVLLHDPEHRVVAAIHAGWRGAVAGILPRTVDLMAERFGTLPGKLRVAIGPSAGACCYEVDEPVLEHVRRYAWWKDVVRETGPNRAKLNLRALVERQAVAAGLDARAVAHVSLCTICHATLFHSYRRDGKVTATMVSGIALTGPASAAARTRRQSHGGVRTARRKPARIRRAS